MYNKCKELKKKTKGITLVALVVTIIVLLILAGVAINFTIGEDGIFKRAQNAVDLYSEAAAKEKLEIMYAGYLIDGGYKDTEKDEIDIFLDIMGDKEITKEDIEEFNKVLEQYGKKIIGITNVEELKSIGKDENYPLNGLYLQLNDISFNDTDTLTPIGSSETPFEGIYDGNNYKIDNLKLANEKDNIGIFSVNKGKIKNIIIENCNMSLNYTKVGTIAGINNGKIINCVANSGSINTNADNDGSRIGGIIGQNGEGGEVVNCANNISVAAEYKLVGGIVGYNLGGNIENCKNYGEISGPTQVGGIAGDSEGLNENNIVNVKNCTNYAKITGDGRLNYESSIGGIVGTNFVYSALENNINEGEIVSDGSMSGGIAGSNSYMITNCKNEGNIQMIYDKQIQVQREIGGIVGRNAGLTENCINVANIQGLNDITDFIGGVTGTSFSANVDEYGFKYGGKIEQCYNSGNISGNNYIGGISGRNSDSAILNSCFNIRRNYRKY